MSEACPGIVGEQRPTVLPCRSTRKELTMIRNAQWKFAGATITLAALMICASPATLARHRHSRSQRLHLGEDFDPPIILAFGTMYGVDGPFLGGANPIRNTPGDDEAWKLTSARGFLTTTGH